MLKFIDMEINHLKADEFKTHNLGLLLETPKPPTELWYQGQLPAKELKLLAVVGSRKYTSYGEQVIEQLFSQLKGYPIGIVSGLALGIDRLAHEAALRHGLYTLAVPGSGLDPSVLYPASHKRLAQKILDSGGGLLSELEPKATAAPWTFPQRNRIMAGLSQATLLIEAEEKSGTLITARLAVDYNRELLAVPGSIFSKNTVGTHQFLKLGATLVTEAKDILEVLNLESKDFAKETPSIDLSPIEKHVIELLHEPQEKDTLLRSLSLPTAEGNMLLMQMEMQGYITYHSPYYRSLI